MFSITANWLNCTAVADILLLSHSSSHRCRAPKGGWLLSGTCKWKLSICSTRSITMLWKVPLEGPWWSNGMETAQCTVRMPPWILCWMAGSEGELAYDAWAYNGRHFHCVSNSTIYMQSTDLCDRTIQNLQSNVWSFPQCFLVLNQERVPYTSIVSSTVTSWKSHLRRYVEDCC